MFDFFNFFSKKKRINFDQLQIMQTVAQQVVLSLEGSAKVPGSTKKVMAVKLVGELLKEMKVPAPPALVDTAIEASVRVINMLDKAPGN